uniref:Uncharacterized protein n=2 Tax=Sphaerodactylus townsendi TaxID=933632 RepID=A0ACB8F9C8_9SAUR
MVYSNVIKIPASSDTIMRKKHVNEETIIIFHVTCGMNGDKISRQNLVAKNDITKHHSKYNINISFYDFSFKTPIYNQYFVHQHQDVFLQVSLHSPDPKLVLFMDTCVASPDINDFTTLTYDLIRSGCVQDFTYQELPSPSNNVVRCKFNALKLLKKHNAIYLKCYLVVCKASDYSSRCYKGCLPTKNRDVTALQDGMTVMGTVWLRKEGKKHEREKRAILTEDEGICPFTIIAMILVVIVFVLAGFLLISKLMKKKTNQIY